VVIIERLFKGEEALSEKITAAYRHMELVNNLVVTADEIEKKKSKSKKKRKR
jgi:hypothetical protein